MIQQKTLLYRLAYRVGFEIGYALKSVALLINFVMFPFPR
jgi:hypothetical protein